MNNHKKRFRKLKIAGIALLLILLVPYLFSRLASPARRVTAHTIEGIQAEAQEKKTLRIVTYNIAHGRGLAKSNWDGGTEADRQQRLDEIAELINSLDADVVVLNEVDFDCSWSGSVNQAAYLAEQCGFPHRVEQRNLDFRILGWTWRFGNAVLSKHRIVEAQVVEFPAYSGTENLLAGKKRGVLCTLDVNGERLRVLGAHLSHRSEAVRARSATLIVELAKAETTPMIVAGDLNSSPSGFPESEQAADGGNVVDTLDASGLFQRRPNEPTEDASKLTYRSNTPSLLIDWILIPADSEFLEYRVIDSTLSDHRPVLAEILLSQSASE